MSVIKIFLMSKFKIILLMLDHYAVSHITFLRFLIKLLAVLALMAVFMELPPAYLQLSMANE